MLFLTLFTLSRVPAQSLSCRAVLQSYNGQTHDESSRLQIVYPRNLDELRQAIQQAVIAGRQIRMSGASHSTSSIILGDTSYYIKSTYLNRIGPVEKIGSDWFVSVEAGVLLGDLSEHLARQGLSMGFAFPAFRGLTIAGLVATGSHGSSRRHTALSHQTVVEIQMVQSNGDLITLRPEDGDLFRAATVNLGHLGAVYKLKLKVVPQFNVKMTSRVMDLNQESLAQYLMGPAQEDYLFVLWFPGQNKAILESGIITNEKTQNGAENVNLGLNQEPSVMDYAFGKALALGRKDTTGVTDAILEKKRFESLQDHPRFIVKKDGKEVPSHSVVGPSHKMLLARGDDLKWPYTLTDNSFSFPIEKIEQVMSTLQDFSKTYNYSFPIAGISFRFGRSAGEKGSFLSHIEDGSSNSNLYVLAEFLEYKPKDTNAVEPSPRDELRDLLMETLITKHKVKLHWGKNNDLAFQAAALQPQNRNFFERFEKARSTLDPEGRFSSQYGLDLLRGKPKEPFYFRNAKQSSIVGSVLYQTASNLMKNYGLRPIPLEGGDRAIMTVTLVDYGMSTFGPYREFVVMIPAQQLQDTLIYKSVESYMVSPPKNDPNATRPRVANFMVLLVLDGQDRIAAQLGRDIGRDLYGYPKELGSIQLKQASSEALQNFEVRLDNDFYLRADLRSSWWNRVEIPFSTDSFAYTTGRGFLQTERMEVKGKTSLPRSLDAVDFELRAAGPYLKLFQGLNFIPEKWSEVSEMSMRLTEVK
ncbi:MAG: FAD-binding protein [Bdellovibrionales bacterium]